MPYKNPRCRECHGRTKHHKWLKYVDTGPYGAKRWSRIVKCKECGHEQKDWKARWGYKRLNARNFDIS